MNRRQWKSISYVHGPQIALIYMMTLGAVIEFAGAFTVGAENYLGVLFFHAALFFSVVALLQVLAIVRFERRYSH